MPCIITIKEPTMLKKSLAALAFSAAPSERNGPRWRRISVFCALTELLCTNVANAWKEKTGNEAKINKMPALLDDAIPSISS